MKVNLSYNDKARWLDFVIDDDNWSNILILETTNSRIMEGQISYNLANDNYKCKVVYLFEWEE